jgi:hypothetical protein
MSRFHIISFAILTALSLSAAVHAAPARKAKPVKSAAPAKAVVRWVPYHHETLGFETRVPVGWHVRKTSKMVGFTSPGDSKAALGVMRSADKSATIEQFADSQFEKEGRPADWVRSPAQVAGMRAMKIVGHPSGKPDMKMVQYYVEGPNGTYLIQCLAPESQWSRYSPYFSTMIGKLQFLQAADAMLNP